MVCRAQTRACYFSDATSLQSMIFSTALFAAVVVAGVGAAILWANPARAVNRAVFLSSCVTTAWLACSHLMMISQGQGLFWLRWTCAVGGLAPLCLWLVKESILSNIKLTDLGWIKRNILWFIGSLVFAILPLTDFFIPSESSDVDRLRGWGYYFYYGGLIAS